MADSERQGGKNATAPVIAGLAVGIVLVVLFSIYESSEKNPSSMILLPVPDEESFSEMPADFSVIYAYGIGAKNILNTANNTYTYDMIGDPSIVINFTLSDLELATIWNSTQENDFFRLKNLTDFCPQHPSPSQCANIIPEKEYRLAIIADGQNHSVMLRQNYELNQAQNTDIQKFKSIAATIDNILSQKEEFKQLPKPRGGYD